MMAWALIVIQILSAPVLAYGLWRHTRWHHAFAAGWLMTGWVAIMIFLIQFVRRGLGLP